MLLTLHGRGSSILAALAALVAVIGSSGCSTATHPTVATASMVATDSTAATAPTAAHDRLPDLKMLPLEAFHLGFQDGHRGLRFSGLVENVGDGPFDVTGVRPDTKTDLKVTENIFQSTGGQRHVSTNAVMRYAQHDGHEHFHIIDFAQYRMRPIGSATWQVGNKEGFCFSDDAQVDAGPPFHYPDDCGFEKPASLRVSEGLSVGWVDDYDWTLWGQFFDLTGQHLPGDFCVSATADPRGLLIEKTRSNNSASTTVHITASEVSVVRQGC